jgi:hypothetical protein
LVHGTVEGAADKVADIYSFGAQADDDMPALGRDVIWRSLGVEGCVEEWRGDGGIGDVEREKLALAEEDCVVITYCLPKWYPEATALLPPSRRRPH